MNNYCDVLPFALNKIADAQCEIKFNSMGKAIGSF
jgi:hypothetical protein